MGVKLKAKYKRAQQAISGTVKRMRASISGENIYVLKRVSIHSKELKMTIQNLEKATLDWYPFYSEKLSRRQSLSDFHVADGAKQKRDKSQSKKIVISEPVKLETEMCQLGMDKLHIRNWDKFRYIKSLIINHIIKLKLSNWTIF